MWVRAERGGLYNADHIMAIDVIGDGDADAMVATLHNGQEVVLARSGWGLSRTHDLLAERLAGGERLIDMRALLKESGELDDESEHAGEGGDAA